jgi:hypothetical protein
MGKPAVPAPDDEVPAADGQVVGTGDMAVPASGGFDEFPEIITADFNIFSFLTDILDTGMKTLVAPQLSQATCAWNGTAVMIWSAFFLQ